MDWVALYDGTGGSQWWNDWLTTDGILNNRINRYN